MKSSVLVALGGCLITLSALTAGAGDMPLWQRFDANKDGSLSPAELAKLESTCPELKGAVSFAMDRNRDGLLSQTELRLGAPPPPATVSATTHAQGTVRRTADGREWDSTLTGSNSRGGSWTGTGHGEVTRGDGTRTVEQEATITRDNGSVVEVERLTIWTKTPDGWTYSSSGSRTGERGTATFTGNGTVTADGSGGATLEGQRQGVRADGTTWEGTVNGTGQRTEDGRQWQREFTGQDSRGNNLSGRSEGSLTRDGSGGFTREANREREVNPPARSHEAREGREGREAPARSGGAGAGGRSGRGGR